MRSVHSSCLVVTSIVLGACVQPETEKRLDQMEAKLGALGTTVMSCTEKGSAFLHTDLGTFMVECEDIKPYAEGFKLSLRVGNPHAVTLNGFEFKVRYGSGPTEKTVSFPEELKPGSWTRVSMVLSPAKAEDFARFKVSMSVSVFTLLIDRR